MRSLSAAEVLQVWERGQTLAPLERALGLLEAVHPGTPREEIARLPLGQRDGLLLALRQSTFGPRLPIYAECPRCGDRLEFEADAREILNTSEMAALHNVASPNLNGDPSEGVRASPQELELDGLRLRWRLFDSLDLAAAARETDPAVARRVLIERCVLEARRGEELLPADRLPEETLLRLAETLAQADPLADVQFDLTCPNCGLGWQLAFDIGAFLWAELQSLARRLLREVHILAQAYGWPEGLILGLSAVRRQVYLEMVQSGGRL